MGVEEMMDWQAYFLSINPEFMTKVTSEPKVFSSAEEEANAIKQMFKLLEE
jgi:hypothetical protein